MGTNNNDSNEDDDNGGVFDFLDTDPNTPGVQLPQWMHTGARVILAVLAVVAVFAAFGGVYALVLELSLTTLRIAGWAAHFNAAVAAVSIPFSALATAKSERHSTRAVSGFWLIVWSVVVLGVLAFYGAVKSEIFVRVDVIVSVGGMTAPLMAALLAAQIGTTIKSLTGEDHYLSSDNSRDLIAKLLAIGLTSFGMFWFAMSRNIDSIYGAVLAIVVEGSFIALVWRKEHTALTRTTMWMFGVLLGLNAVETGITNLNLAVPGRAFLTSIGSVSIALSPLIVILTAIAMAEQRNGAEPATFTSFVIGRINAVRDMRSAFAEAMRATPVSHRLPAPQADVSPVERDDDFNDAMSMRPADDANFAIPTPSGYKESRPAAGFHNDEAMDNALSGARNDDGSLKTVIVPDPKRTDVRNGHNGGGLTGGNPMRAGDGTDPKA